MFVCLWSPIQSCRSNFKETKYRAYCWTVIRFLWIWRTTFMLKKIQIYVSDSNVIILNFFFMLLHFQRYSTMMPKFLLYALLVFLHHCKNFKNILMFLPMFYACCCMYVYYADFSNIKSFKGTLPNKGYWIFIYD